MAAGKQTGRGTNACLRALTALDRLPGTPLLKRSTPTLRVEGHLDEPLFTFRRSAQPALHQNAVPAVRLVKRVQLRLGKHRHHLAGAGVQLDVTRLLFDDGKTHAV